MVNYLIFHYGIFIFFEIKFKKPNLCLKKNTSKILNLYLIFS
jgi:hypothetical protein